MSYGLINFFPNTVHELVLDLLSVARHHVPLLPTQRTTILSLKVNLLYAVNYMALCGTNLVTSPSEWGGGGNLLEGLVRQFIQYKTTQFHPDESS